MKEEIGKTAERELARLFRGINVSVVQEGIDNRLDVKFRHVRSFEIEMMSLHVSFHSHLLKAEPHEVVGIDQDAISKPKRQEKEPFQAAHPGCRFRCRHN